MLMLNNIKVEKGWIFAELIDKERYIYLRNSNMFNNDVIGDSLRMILNFLTCSCIHERVIWNGENDYHVIDYTLEYSDIKIAVNYFDQPFYPDLVINNTQNSKNIVWRYEEKVAFWDWSEKMYNEICKIGNDSDCSIKTASEIPTDITRKIEQYFKF